MAASPDDGLTDFERARRKARIALATSDYPFDSYESEGQHLERWRIQIDSRNASHIDLKITARFPFELPDAYVDPQLYGRVPHVDKDGKVCFVDESSAHYDPEDIGEVVLWCINRVRNVLDVDPETVPLDEFAIEFEAYFRPYREFLSLVTDLDSPRMIDIIWLEAKRSGGYSFMACDDHTKGERWLKNAGYVATIRTKGLFVPEAFPARPPFPETSSEICDRLLSGSSKDYGRWEQFLKQDRRHAVVLSTVSSSRGKSLLAWQHSRVACPVPTSAQGRMNGAVPGFRPAKHPISFEMRGWGGTQKIERYFGARVDVQRLVGRTIGDADTASAKHVVLIGGGSLGSNLMMSLVKSHIFERASIMDKDFFDVENVLRHECSFARAGDEKASALAKLVGEHCPWMILDPKRANVLNALDTLRSWFETADMVILATGVDRVERLIVDIALETCKPATPIHRIWLTEGAMEGQIVRYVAGWPRSENVHPTVPTSDLSEVKYEPGCSPGYVQYGGSPLLRFISVANDAILSPVDKPWQITWVARPQEDFTKQDCVLRAPLFAEAQCGPYAS